MGIRLELSDLDLDDPRIRELVGGAAPGKPKTRSKYNAEPTVYKGRRYASKAEAERAKQLDFLKLSGKVLWWEPQVPFTISDDPAVGRCWVDFLVCEVEPDGIARPHAEDVKGYVTPEFRKQVKRWKVRGPIPLHVIKKGKTEIIPRGSDA